MSEFGPQHNPEPQVDKTEREKPSKEKKKSDTAGRTIEKFGIFDEKPEQSGKTAGASPVREKEDFFTQLRDSFAGKQHTETDVEQPSITTAEAADSAVYAAPEVEVRAPHSVERAVQQKEQAEQSNYEQPAGIDTLSEEERSAFMPEVAQRFRDTGSHVTRLFERDPEATTPDNNREKAREARQQPRSKPRVYREQPLQQQRESSPRLPQENARHEQAPFASGDTAPETHGLPSEPEPIVRSPEQTQQPVAFYSPEMATSNHEPDYTAAESTIPQQSSEYTPMTSPAPLEKQTPYSEKHDKQKFWRGFLAGGIVAGLWGRHKRRKLEKRLDREVTTQKETNKTLQTQYESLQQQIASERSARATNEQASPARNHRGKEQLIPKSPPLKEHVSERVLSPQAGADALYPQKEERVEFAPLLTPDVEVTKQHQSTAEQYPVNPNQQAESVEQKPAQSWHERAEQIEARKESTALHFTTHHKVNPVTPPASAQVHRGKKHGLRDNLVAMPSRHITPQEKQAINHKPTQKRVQASTWITYATVVGIAALLIFIFLS